MSRATGWDLCLGTATSRNAVCQDLSAVALSPTSTSPPLVVEPHRFPQLSLWSVAQMVLLGSVPQCWGARRPPRVLFFHWRNYRPRGPSQCSAVPVWGGAMWSECSWSSHPSNVVLFSLPSRLANFSVLVSILFVFAMNSLTPAYRSLLRVK